MSEAQLDLFSGRGVPAPPGPSQISAPPLAPPSALDAAALIAALPGAGLVDTLRLAAEAGHRRLAAAIPVLERLCRRFAGFGVDRAVPEQIAALDALAAIGGRAAADAVARIIIRKIVQGPTLAVAVNAAARLGGRCRPTSRRRCSGIRTRQCGPMPAGARGRNWR